MRTILLLLMAFVCMPSMSMAQSAAQKKVEAVRKFIARKYPREHKEVVLWMKNQKTQRPTPPSELIRAYNLFVKFYRADNNEKNARAYEVTVKKLTEVRAQPKAPVAPTTPEVDEFAIVDEPPKPKTQKNGKRRDEILSPQSEGFWYLTAGYMLVTDKVEVATPSMTEEVNSNFSGITLGVGSDFSNNIGIEAQFSLLNGDVKTDEVLQKSAVMSGVMASGNYIFALSNSFKFKLGAAVMTKSFKTTATEEVETKLKTTMSFGPEAQAQWEFSDSLFLKVGGAYFQNGPAIRLGVGFKL